MQPEDTLILSIGFPQKRLCQNRLAIRWICGYMIAKWNCSLPQGKQRPKDMLTLSVVATYY